MRNSESLEVDGKFTTADSPQPEISTDDEKALLESEWSEYLANPLEGGPWCEVESKLHSRDKTVSRG